MKKTNSILWFCICWLSPLICLATTSTFALNGNNKVVKGSGKVISEERSVTVFSKVYASSGINVFIEQGNSCSLKISADDNLIEYIRTKVSDSTLQIGLQEGISLQNAQPMNVYVKMEHIESLKTISAANIKAPHPLTVRNISLMAKSGGDIEIELDAQQIHASLTSGANIILKGQVESLKGELSSGANLKAPELKAKVCDIHLTSGADAYINVERSISYSISSGASLTCKGHPKVTNTYFSRGKAKFE